MQKPAPVGHPIHDLLRSRWSPRAFATRTVEPEVLLAVLEAARWAPSASNEQPWRFVVARREEAADHQRMLDCLVPGNQRWAAQPPVLILTATRLDFERTGKPNRHAFHDAGLALAMLLVEATARGLATHPMAGFEAEKARAAWGIPPEFEPVAVTALGYPGDAAELPEDLRARELAPRQRRPLAESVYAGSWGRSAPYVRG